MKRKPDTLFDEVTGVLMSEVTQHTDGHLRPRDLLKDPITQRITKAIDFLYEHVDGKSAYVKSMIKLTGETDMMTTRFKQLQDAVKELENLWESFTYDVNDPNLNDDDQ